MSKQRHTTLRELAYLLWMMVVAHPASLPAPFHYRHLVSAKSRALQSGHTYKAVQERTHNINYWLLFWLMSFASNQRANSIFLHLDNITAIAFLNRMGGTHSPLLSRLAVEIWNWCIERNLTIHAEHLPRIENAQVDWKSWTQDRFQELEA